MRFVEDRLDPSRFYKDLWRTILDLALMKLRENLKMIRKGSRRLLDHGFIHVRVLSNWSSFVLCYFISCFIFVLFCVLFGLFFNVSLLLSSKFLHVRIFRSFFISFCEYDIHSSIIPCCF